jgi:hypothetical protein
MLLLLLLLLLVELLLLLLMMMMMVVMMAAAAAAVVLMGRTINVSSNSLSGTVLSGLTVLTNLKVQLRLPSLPAPLSREPLQLRDLCG